MENKKYATLLLDPPFATMQTGTYGACKHYPLMSVEEVKKMPIMNTVIPFSFYHILPR